jgi:transposase-like protein
MSVWLQCQVTSPPVKWDSWAYETPNLECQEQSVHRHLRLSFYIICHMLLMSTATTTLDHAVECYHAQDPADTRNNMSIETIARNFGVSRSTLANRIRGVQTSHTQSHEHTQVLSPSEETCLVDYIRCMSQAGHPPPPRTVRETAQHIITSRQLDSAAATSSAFTPYILGTGWLARFKARHPDLSTLWSRGLESARIDRSAAPMLAPYLAELGILLSQHSYPPSNMLNMDESGYGIGTAQEASQRVMVVLDLGKGASRKPRKLEGSRQE